MTVPSADSKGTMTDEWLELSFGQAVQFNPPTSLQRGNVYPFVDMAAVKPGFRSVYPSEVRPFKGGGSRFHHGDTLMARITPSLENGKISRYSAPNGVREGHGSTEFIVIRGRAGVTDNDFAYYLTQWKEVRDYAIIQMTGTSGRQRVPVDSLNNLVVPIPPVSEQQAIAHILGTLDDKIELNRRMNRTLEEMARAISQDWFVDFGPVRAKMDGQEPYLPPELWELFPDELVDSELGEIPEGWEVKSMSAYASLNPESWSKRNFPEDMEYVDLANTKWGTIESTRLFPWKAAPSRARRVLKLGDTIVGTVRPGNGSYALVGRDGLTGSTGFAVLRPLNQRFRELVYLAATDPDNIERLANRADGAAYPAVTPEAVLNSQVVTPIEGANLIDSFSDEIRPLMDKMEGNQAEIRSLAAFRNELLPSLLSGELKLKND